MDTEQTLPLFQQTPSEPTRVMNLDEPSRQPAQTEPDEASRRSGGSGGRRVLVGVVTAALVCLLVVGALVADGVFRNRTEDDVAAQVAQQVGSDPGDVEVHITGWPFLAVLATDTLDGIDVSVPTANLRQDGRTVVFHDVRLHGTGVRNARQSENTVFDHATASARIDWDQLSQVAGATISHAGDRRVQVRRDLQVLGANVNVSVSAVPGVDGATRRVTLDQPTASLGGIPVPSSLLTPAMEAVTQRAELPDLGALGYDKLDVEPDGLVVDLSGDDVRVDDLKQS